MNADLTNLIYALSVPFACGVAVQRLIAILDAAFAKFEAGPVTKAWMSALISFLFGLLVTLLGNVRILSAISRATKQNFLGIWPYGAGFVDVIVTALIVSAGTEGFNSIIKFLGYAKDQKKAQAADNIKTAKVGDAQAMAALPS